MTPEQRERMEFYASRPKTQLAIAVRAALAEIDALRKDRERLTWLLEKYDRYLHDDIWEKASETCPVDWDEAENVAKWGRVGIDALMTIDAISEATSCSAQ